MKNFATVLFLFTLIIIGCQKYFNEDELAYEKEGWDFKDFQPETLTLSETSMNGNPIILSKEELEKNRGEPFKKKCDCFSTHVLRERISSDCWIYDKDWNLVYYFDFEEDLAYVNRLSFENTNLEIKTPEITLSKNTTFKEIKKKFPNAYAHRNMGAHEYRREGGEWIFLTDDSPLENKAKVNSIELRFKKGKLKEWEYRRSPKYNEAQWEIHKKQFEFYKNENK